MAYDSSSEDGFYQPPRLPNRPLENVEEFANRLKFTLHPVIIDGINNLVSILPGAFSEQTLLGGEEVIWLRRKISGIPCPNQAYGDTDEQCAISKCQLCFGTTYLGGYDCPVKLRMSFNPQKADINMEQAGLVIQEMPTAWTVDTDPIMKSMDLIVTYGNERYLIANQESETIQGKRMFQRLVLTKPDKYDVTYSVPVPSIYGDAYTDFAASLTIRAPKQDFLATITIHNFYWYPTTGLLNRPTGE